MKKASLDPSRRLDIYLRLNRVNSKTFTFLTSADQPFPIVYEDLILIIKTNPGNLNNIVSLSYGNGLTVNANQINVAITVDQSNFFNEGEYYWELVNQDAMQTWINGSAFFHNGQFDGVGDESIEIIIGLNDPVTVVVDQPFVDGGGLPQNIEQVLTNGNDANGLAILHVSEITGKEGEGINIESNASGINCNLAITESGITFNHGAGVNSLFGGIDSASGMTLNMSGSNDASYQLGSDQLTINVAGHQILVDVNGVTISLASGKNLRAIGLPTSSAGLASGTLWRNGNVVNIIP